MVVHFLVLFVCWSSFNAMTQNADPQATEQHKPSKKLLFRVSIFSSILGHRFFHYLPSTSVCCVYFFIFLAIFYLSHLAFYLFNSFISIFFFYLFTTIYLFPDFLSFLFILCIFIFLGFPYFSSLHLTALPLPFISIFIFFYLLGIFIFFLRQSQQLAASLQ